MAQVRLCSTDWCSGVITCNNDNKDNNYYNYNNYYNVEGRQAKLVLTVDIRAMG